jgi:hypothetical protein
VQLKNSLCEELENATREVVQDFKEKTENLDEDEYLKMLGFNPKVFLHTIENIDGVRKQVKSLILAQLNEMMGGDEDLGARILYIRRN